MKIWRGNEKTDDKIIAFIDSTIYKGNPRDEEIEHCISDLKNGIVPAKIFFSIPVPYIKEIRMQEEKNYLQVFFGQDSEEHLRIQDEMMRKEVFDYFKQNIANTAFTTDHYSKLKAGKKPLIAMAVVAALFLYTLVYAIGYDKGYQYETVNGRYDSLTGIVLSIASFGVIKTVLIFSILLAIAGWSFYRKASHPPIIHRLVFIRK